MAKESTVKIDLPDGLHTPGTATDSLSVLRDNGEAGVPAVVPWNKVFEFASKLSDEEYTLFRFLTKFDLERKHYRADQWAYLLYLYSAQLSKPKGKDVPTTLDRLKSASEASGGTRDGFEALHATLLLDNLSEDQLELTMGKSATTPTKEQEKELLAALESVNKTLIQFVIRATSVEQIEPRYKWQMGVALHTVREKIGGAGKWLSWVTPDDEKPDLTEIAPKKPSLISARLHDSTLNFPFLEEVFNWWSGDFETHYLSEQIAHLTNEQLLAFLYYMRTVYTDCRNKMQAASCQKVCVMIEEELTQRVAKTLLDEEKPEGIGYKEAIDAEILIPWHKTLQNGIDTAEKILKEIKPHGDIGVFRAAQRRFVAWLKRSPKTDDGEKTGEKPDHPNAQTIGDILWVAGEALGLLRDGAAIARDSTHAGSVKKAAKEAAEDAVKAAAHRATGKKTHHQAFYPKVFLWYNCEIKKNKNT